MGKHRDEEDVQQSALEILIKKSDGDYKAFLYDCDGTLADNMDDHKKAYAKVAENHGVTIDTSIVDELAGQPTPKVVEAINKRYNCDLDPEEFASEKSDLFYEEFVPKTKPMKFVVEHLKQHAGKVKIAVVSGGVRKSVTKTLEVLGIADVVDTVICADDTSKGKPNPDPFLAAAEKVGVKPEYCLVFEDGDPGVEAAKAAGMGSVRVDKILEESEG